MELIAAIYLYIIGVVNFNLISLSFNGEFDSSNFFYSFLWPILPFTWGIVVIKNRYFK